jgi:Zn finger protein HypA/HybF involved in hydrogenase expression
MAKFKCNACKQVYEDYYPPDDTCLKCKKGTVRIINELKEQFLKIINLTY